MLADLLNLVLVGGVVGLIIAGVLAWRLRRRLRAVADRNRELYEQLGPQTVGDFLAQLRDQTVMLMPPSSWQR